MNKKLLVIVALVITLFLVKNVEAKNYVYEGDSPEKYEYSTTKDSISYGSNSFNCSAGQTIDTLIRTTSDNTRVRSFGSYDTSIATVEKNPEIAVNCINCSAVRINCKKQGNAKIYAKSSSGATTTSTVNVDNNSMVKFEKKYYNCKKGESIVTMIKASAGTYVKSYKSLNNSIASVRLNPDLQPKCLECLLVKITCKKAGSTQLVAKSSTGAKDTSNIAVGE